MLRICDFIMENEISLKEFREKGKDRAKFKEVAEFHAIIEV